MSRTVSTGELSILVKKRQYLLLQTNTWSPWPQRPAPRHAAWAAKEVGSVVSLTVLWGILYDYTV